MLFSYKAIDKTSTAREGTVDAQNIESAIETVEGRGYTVISVAPIDEGKGGIFNFEVTWFERVSNKEIVIFSRQIATLFPYTTLFRSPTPTSNRSVRSRYRLARSW